MLANICLKTKGFLLFFWLLSAVDILPDCPSSSSDLADNKK